MLEPSNDPEIKAYLDKKYPDPRDKFLKAALMFCLLPRTPGESLLQNKVGN